MKIAVFHNFPPGGGKRTVFEQVKGLINLGHVIDVYELSNPQSYFWDLSALKCRMFKFDFSLFASHPPFLTRLEKDWRNLFVLSKVHRKIAQLINNGGYNVALIHSDKYTESPFILRYLTIPHIYHCHEWLRLGYEKELAFTERVILPKKIYELLTRQIRKLVDKSNAKSAQTIITNSKFTQNNILTAYDRQAVICHSGVDTDIFRPFTHKKKHILFMGQKNFVGGYEFVQKFFSLLPPKIKPRLQSFGFPKGRPDIHNDHLLAQAYSSALATLCVSYNEPFGLKSIESMACGTPVLAVNEGGYPESVIDGKNGWLLPRNPDLFAQKIIQLIKYPEISVQTGKAARKHVVRNWTWKRHVDQLEEILKHAVQS